MTQPRQVTGYSAHGGAAFVARGGRQVRPHVAARDEEQAGVRVRRRDEPAAVLDHEELEDRQEALEVRLLVDREVEMAVGDRAQRPRQQVVAARADAARCAGRASASRRRRPASSRRRRRTCRAASCARRTSPRSAPAPRRTPGPVATTVARIGLPESLIASSAPSMRGWMFSCPGVAMKRNTSPRLDELDDPGAELQARLVEVLADVREPPVADAAVGVVGDDRDAASQRLRRRLVERSPVDHRHGDAVGPAVDRAPHRLHHLADVAAPSSPSTRRSRRSAGTRPGCRSASGRRTGSSSRG